MKAIKFLILTMIINTALAQENNPIDVPSMIEGSSLELPQIQVVPIKASKTDRNYELYIELPEDYAENNTKTYPVLYYTDAMWHLEMLSGSTEYMLEDVILVGISWQLDINKELKKEIGAHVSRFRDYSFRPSEKPDIQTKFKLGQANTHIDFIRNDVFNYVDNTYRTDPNSRTYFGYSMGGEFGSYILMSQPDTFNNYIIGSPSIKNEVPYLTEFHSKLEPYDAANRNTSLNANVFITHGSLETDMVAPIDAFVSVLNNRRDDGLSVLKEVIDGNHGSAFPMTAVRSIAWLSSLLGHETTNDPELSFWDVPQLNNAIIIPTPADRKDGLLVGALGKDGGNTEMILALAKKIEDHKQGNFDSFLIAHKGKLLFESYYARGRINLPHPQASATKVYTSFLLGRAIQLGYLNMDDLDKPLTSFLKDLDPTKLVDGAEKITLHHALTMRSGIRISEEQQEKMDKNPSKLKGQGKVQALLEHSAPITDESQVFKYAGGPDLVMQVIEAVVPGSAEDFIKNELLDKLGITNYKWTINDITGLPESGWRVSITSRDMVKLGQLAMNKGTWNNEQLIPEAYLTKATNRIVRQGDDDNFDDDGNVTNTGYGYFWWQADMKVGDKNYFTTSARGGGGQYIFLIEELDLILVFTAHDGDSNFLQLTAERILPAFEKK